MPCCIKKEMYLGEACSVQLSSSAALSEHDDRYSLLCGAMAHKYSAQLVSAIDPRITNRHIVIAGGVGIETNGIVCLLRSNPLLNFYFKYVSSGCFVLIIALIH